MFNTSYYKSGSVSNSQSIKINAVSGAILKNHPKSWFKRFHLQSDTAKELFAEGGHKAYYGSHSWERERTPDKDITILQMVICGDMEVVAECVYTKDYEIDIVTIEKLQAEIDGLRAENIRLTDEKEEQYKMFAQRENDLDRVVKEKIVGGVDCITHLILEALSGEESYSALTVKALVEKIANDFKQNINMGV